MENLENDIERNTSDKDIELILAFVDENFIETEISEVQYKNLRNLSDFIKRRKINLNEFDSDILLEKSNKIDKMLYVLYEANLLQRASNLKMISTLIDIYCIKNGITEIIDSKDNQGKDLNLFQVYMDDLSEFKLLSKEEEKELIEKAYNKDEEARRKLIEHNLKFVVYIASRYNDDSVDLSDKIQFGNEGLVHAALKVRPDKECKFATYAAFWIRQYITRGIANYGRAIRIPVIFHHEIIMLKRLTNEYRIQNNGQYPSNKQLAEMMNLPEHKIMTLKEWMKPVMSLDAPVKALKDNSPLIDTIEDPSPSLEQQIETDMEELFVNVLLNELYLKEKTIIKLRYGFDGNEPKTLEEIGSLYGLTRERIRQIEKKVLKYIKRRYLELEETPQQLVNRMNSR